MSKHTDAAQSFLKMAGMGKVQEAYDQYVASSFIHHNQSFKGDRQSLESDAGRIEDQSQ
jgi:hypothetical protein